MQRTVKSMYNFLMYNVQYQASAVTLCQCSISSVRCYFMPMSNIKRPLSIRYVFFTQKFRK
jgi:hypothetical protein